MSSMNDAAGVELDVLASSLDLDQSLLDCFAQRSLSRASHIALGSDAWQPTYQELNRLANRLAHALLARVGTVGDRVAVLMRHDAPLIAAVLAILKAGRTVVVLNSTDPPARHQQVLEDEEQTLLLVDRVNLLFAWQSAPQSCALVCLEDHASEGSVADPDVPISPDDIAFIIYTSGSTGRPKGVMQTHRNILHNVLRLSRGLGLCADDRILLHASLSGGLGLSTTWCALLNGARLCPFPIMEKGCVGLADWMARHGITVFPSSASVFRHFLQTLDATHHFPAVRVIRLGSEPATAADFAGFHRHFPDQCSLFHTLSSSETGNISIFRLTRADCVTEGRLPVGRPSEGIEIALVNEQGREVVPGEIGEILVQSRYLSPG